MENEKKYYMPDYAVHPGEYLEEVLEAREIKKRELSDRLGISVKHLSQIINKQALLTANMSVKLEKTLGISANIWNNLNANYSLFEARAKDLKSLRNKEEWLNSFPIKELIKYRFISGAKNSTAIIESLLKFFRIPSPKQWNEYYGNLDSVCFRKSPAYSDDLMHIASWLRAGEILAQDVITENFSKDNFKKNLLEIRKLTIKDPREFQSKIKDFCAKSGVILVFLPEFEKTHLSGATRWLTSDKALIIMSLRYKTNDHFWFTFFHEAGHILLHGKKEIFIDDSKGYLSNEEEEANRFARNIIISEDEYKKFISKKKFFDVDIKTFAEKIGIHPGIVVGMLQHDKLIKFNWHNKFKEKFEFKHEKIIG